MIQLTSACKTSHAEFC